MNTFLILKFALINILAIVIWGIIIYKIFGLLNKKRGINVHKIIVLICFGILIIGSILYYEVGVKLNSRKDNYRIINQLTEPKSKNIYSKQNIDLIKKTFKSGHIEKDKDVYLAKEETFFLKSNKLKLAIDKESRFSQAVICQKTKMMEYKNKVNIKLYSNRVKLYQKIDISNKVPLPELKYQNNILSLVKERDYKFKIKTIDNYGIFKDQFHQNYVSNQNVSAILGNANALTVITVSGDVKLINKLDNIEYINGNS